MIHPIRLPVSCAKNDFERADLVIAMKETEHRPLVRERHAAWEHSVIYWNIHDIDVAADFIETARIVKTLVDRLIDEMILPGLIRS